MVYVRFERGRDNVIGPTFGPFPFVQVTYNVVRYGPEGKDLAYLSHLNDDWEINDWEINMMAPDPVKTGNEGDDYNFSDFIVYDADQPE